MMKGCEYALWFILQMAASILATGQRGNAESPGIK